jgi:uncharacterized protein DUF2252
LEKASIVLLSGQRTYAPNAHGHASTGETAKIAGYMGKSDTFDEAIADFSVAYADQGEKDHEALKKAVRAGKLEVAHLA